MLSYSCLPGCSGGGDVVVVVGVLMCGRGGDSGVVVVRVTRMSFGGRLCFSGPFSLTLPLV